MLPLLFITMLRLLSPFGSCSACESPTRQIQQEYLQTSFVPDVMQTNFGLQIIAPDTPYVAATGRNELFFIDTCLDNATAQYIKNQIEAATIPRSNEYIYIDEIEATAERRNADTHEATFVFDPEYARIFFARGMNKHNPDLKLPEHGPAGDWQVAYDLDAIAGKMNAA